MNSNESVKTIEMTKEDLLRGPNNRIAHAMQSDFDNYRDLLSGVAITAGTESRNVLATQRNSIETQGRAIYGDKWDNLNAAQRKAFEISTLAWADLNAYHGIASKVNVSSESRLLPTGSIDQYLEPTLNFANEAYDARSILNSKIATTVVNVGSARQDDFAEMFYETIVLPPDEGNFRVSVENTYVMTDYLHTGTGMGGVPKGFGSVNLVDALINPEVLRDSSIKIVPIYSASSPIFSSEVGPWMYGGKTETGALKFNTAIDLLAASNDSMLNPSQVPDSTDQLDHDNRIETLFLKVTDTAAGTSDIIPLDLSHVPGASFVPSPMGKVASRDMVLNFHTDVLPIHGGMKDASGNLYASLSTLRDVTRKDWVVYLDLSLFGNVNLETSSIRVNDSKVQIASVWNQVKEANGLTKPVQIVNATDLNNLTSSLTIEMVAWYPLSQRTNFNRRTRGLLCRTDILSESYTIPMGTPISVLTPVVDTETLVDLEGPIRLNRARNSQNALTTLKEYGESLKRYANANDVYSPRPEVWGVGRYIMRPYYDETELDLVKLVDSLRSNERMEDLNSAILLYIRSRVTKAWSQSNFGPAWQAMGIEGNPLVNIGTNSEIGSYLDVKADNRILGALFDARLATTNNRECGDTIYINFSTKTNDICFKSGYFLYIPEVVSALPKTTNGGQSTQLTVQNRNMHLNHCPIQIRIHLKGLNEVLEKKMPMRVITS